MEKQFSSIESEINRPLTLLTKISLILLFAVIFIALFVWPIYDVSQKGILYYAQNETEIFFTIATIQIMVCIGVLFLIRFYYKNLKSAPVRIIVNEKGILYYNSEHEIVSSILYADLLPGQTKSYKKDIYTEYSSQKYAEKNLTVNIKQNGLIVQAIVSINLDLHILSNRYVLYAHFIKGVQTFRPELTIDHLVYDNYYIDQKSQLYSRANQKKDIKAMLLLALAICSIVYFVIILLKMFV
jgi:4-amino-4-deoxy-L-arabinose transferase-like glycosyltransferase